MLLTIENSSDWNSVIEQLKQSAKGIGYNPDLVKMFKNIDAMVTELNKLEVDARRTKRPAILESKIKQINEAITTVESWIIVLSLSK